MTDVDAALAEFSQSIRSQVPGDILLTRVAGSHSYGVVREDSDVDFLAVYRWPLYDVLGLTHPVDVVTHKDPDWQAWEISKFCEMLAEGKPNAIECLLSDKWCQTIDLHELLLHKRDFLTVKAIKQYIGYALNQIKRWRAGQSVHSASGKPTEKWAYHIARLLSNAEEIVDGKLPQIYKPDNERLMRVRNGEQSIESVATLADITIAHLDQVKPWPLPEQVDMAWLNKAIAHIRMRGPRESVEELAYG